VQKLHRCDNRWRAGFVSFDGVTVPAITCIKLLFDFGVIDPAQRPLNIEWF
jgi:hypothetical protein